MDKRRSEIFYFDDEGHIVDKEAATNAVIRELDENGKLLKEVFGRIERDDDD